MIKIAVPTRDNSVDDHFGHCAYYTIFSIEDQEIKASTTLPSPPRVWLQKQHRRYFARDGRRSYACREHGRWRKEKTCRPWHRGNQGVQRTCRKGRKRLPPRHIVRFGRSLPPSRMSLNEKISLPKQLEQGDFFYVDKGSV